MTRKHILSLFFAAGTAVFAAADVAAQYPSGVKAILAGTKHEQTLSGAIKVPKNFGKVPMGPGHKQAAAVPCGQFYIAIMDPAKGNRAIKTTSGLTYAEEGDYYLCKFSMTVPTDKKLFVNAGMGGSNLLPKEDRAPMYITDAWIGGTGNKPRRGWERGFVGKTVTLNTRRGTYLTFDLIYVQVDPN